MRACVLVDERLVVRGGVEERGELRGEGLDVLLGGDVTRAGDEEVGHARVRLFFLVLFWGWGLMGGDARRIIASADVDVPVALPPAAVVPPGMPPSRRGAPPGP